MSYQIVLPQFEGPFDLLLFFIERDELDIYDIPIAKLTEDFLAYMHQLEETDIEVASEFILVAATLMRIKARLLLPRKDKDEDGNEIDPRQELVQKLIEYKMFKEVTEQLKALEDDRAKQFQRGNIADDSHEIALESIDGEAELHNLNLYTLMRAFNKVVLRFEEKKQQLRHKIVKYNYTIDDQKDYISKLVKAHKEASFDQLFENCENKVHAIYTFLAMLEMISQGKIEISIRDGVNNFVIKKAS